jgi:serine protease Do
MMRVLKLTILAAALGLAACGAGTPAYIEHQKTAPAVTALATPDDAKVIGLSRIVYAMTNGDRVGVVRSGWLCTRQAQMVWGGNPGFANERDVLKTFTAELRKANYPVLGDPDALFPDDHARADLIVAGRITDFKANFCHPNTDDDVRGEMSVTIEWQLFDPISRRTLHKVTATGDSKIDDAVLHGRQLLFNMALAQATQGLLADKTFHAIATNETPPAAATPVDSVFKLFARPPRAEPIARNMAEVQAATVTVLAGGAWGSGFFVSGDGYLLTNAHVVGDLKFVRVRLATGREIAAEVIVVNRVRDVALVKVAETGLVSLPVAMGEPQVGSEIFAIGAPREQALATSVTRGIVSAYRVRGGQRLIQGDVTVQHGNSGGPLTDSFGNVVGITVSGLTHGDYSIGLNFFIPIQDALKGAGIEFGEVRTVAQMRALDRMVAVALQPGRPRPVPKPAPEIGAAPAAPQESQQVASLAPVAVPAQRDGAYRSKFTAATINGLSYVDLAIVVEGDRIRGTGQTRGGLQCRANGEIDSDGAAWINIACSNAGTSYLSWQLAGRFAPEQGGAIYVGRLSYANLNNGPGEAVFEQ